MDFYQATIFVFLVLSAREIKITKRLDHSPCLVFNILFFLQKDAEFSARDQCALQEGHLRHGVLLGLRRTVWSHPWGTEDPGGVFRGYNNRPHVQKVVSDFLLQVSYK